MFSEAHIHRLYAQGADRIFRLVRQLECRIEEMEAQLTHSPQPVIALLTKELDTARRTLARQTQELIEQRQLNHQLLRRIRELEAEVEAAPRQVARDSHNSSLPPSTDAPWQKIKRTRSLRQKNGRKPGGQYGHRGTTLRQVAHPDQIIIHAPRSCAGCGVSLQAAAVVAITRRQVFDLAAGSVHVTEHRAEHRHCLKCAVTTKAAFPTNVRAPAQYGTGVLSRVVYLNLYQLIPVARTCETMRDLFACHISQATVQRVGRFCSGKLVRTEQRIKASICDSTVIGADETGLRVAGTNGWIHVARTNGLTHYGFDTRRGKAAMDEIGILPQFSGTLVRDGFPSYKWYERCRHSLCNAHLLRELVFTEEVDPAQKVWTTPLAKLLIKIKDSAAAAKTNDNLQLSEKTKHTFLRRYDRLVKKADRLNPSPPKKLAKKLGERAPPEKKRLAHPTPRTLVNRLQRRRDDILRFMADPAVPFDNNGSERDLRMIKLQQKVSGCFRTPDGARNFCRVRSYLSTARKQGFSLLYSLQRVLKDKPLVFQESENRSVRRLGS